MKRRNFIAGLGLAPLFGAPSFLERNNKEHTEKAIRNFVYTKTYRGFDIYWSKYINHADTEKITGYWTGYKDKENIGFYACTGGYSGDYILGAVFNVCVLADHKFLTVRSSEDDKEEEMKRAFYLLKEEIDYYYSNPKEKEKFEFKFGFSGFKNAKD